jgi:hypothetical protein
VRKECIDVATTRGGTWARTVPEKVTTIYQLKITLKRSKPPIWRRVLVPADIHLGKLHCVIQATMGWRGGHLHGFTVGYRQEAVYYGPKMPADMDDYDAKDESRARLNSVLPAVKAKLEYEYDFGDSWEHTVVLEKILPPVDGQTYPSCIGGERACPPEDCGGIWGYYQLLETLADPANPEHEEMMEWTGGPLDPEAFNLEAANRRVNGCR